MSTSIKPHNKELSKRSNVKLKQKIEIFEKFMKTGEELVGNTTFEGYPIGHWAIQIRNSLKRMNDGKYDRSKTNLTEEQLEKLESMGILERQIDSTIDEKIDSLVEWRKKYPKIKIIPIATEEELREYAKTDTEFRKIQEEYEKIQRYYDYVRYRKNKGKLSEEQISRGKNGEIGGVFGYPTKIEELAKRYGIIEKDIKYLLTKFGTLDNFYEMHNIGKIESKKDRTLEERIIRNIVDIDDNSNIGYNKLYRDITRIDARKKGVYFYSSEKLQKLIETLRERDKYVIESIYGLMEGKKPKTQDEVGKEIGITRSRVFEIKQSVLRRLRHPYRDRQVRINFEIEDDEYITDKERQQFEEIKKNIQLQNGDVSENLKKLKSIYDEVKKRIEEQKKIKERNIQEQEEKEEEARRKEELKHTLERSWIPVEQLLELQYLTYRDLLEMGINPELAAKHILEIDRFKSKIEDIKRLKLSRLCDNKELSVRAYNCLVRVGIESLADLSRMTNEQIMRIRNLGKKSYNEIIDLMKRYEIFFLDAENETYVENKELLMEIESVNQEIQQNKEGKERIEQEQPTEDTEDNTRKRLLEEAQVICQNVQAQNDRLKQLEQLEEQSGRLRSNNRGK